MRALRWDGKELILLDQTLLPTKVRYFSCRSAEEVTQAITSMQVRGAPAIGVAAAFGLVLAAREYSGMERPEFIRKMEQAVASLAATRPTAVNLFWALRRMENIWQNNQLESIDGLRRLLEQEAVLIQEEDLQKNLAISRHGSKLIPGGASILTHCNAGALATAGYGTALGVIRAAHEQGKIRRVYADETRPLLQGARLTAWELMEEGIPVTLIADNMAGYLMKQHKIDAVLVGADRITSQGDTANKIGTYSLAVLAQYHGISFYVAAPLSTIDFSLNSGGEIPIEERLPGEVTTLCGVVTAPPGVSVYNPAFDVTPAALITAIITEQGVCRAPYEISLKGGSTHGQSAD
jgi:methylthioribose-1-phosphate isomerase